ncbi:MAG: hypothetical protein PHC28_15710 [Flavobacterium sp.]|uniref:LamG-like jellyroll fold domain-containing protein n=1 Tax=Flavobacterium sp. TaxID=239 RepID=UPI002619360B|nr:LamG-like jellyroll fold domain-containing protein [Flavobacterium sp.]MDD5151900.1 hypothetical protein [Flavobacterium sp.]
MGTHTYGDIQDRTTNPTQFSYQLGSQSLIELEPQDNKSMCFGRYENTQKAYIQISKTTHLVFPTNSYSIEFVFNKTARNYLYPYNIVSPIISKVGLIYVYIEPSGSNDYIVISSPDGESRSTTIQIPFNGYYNKEVHFVFTREVIEKYPNDWRSTESVYFEGSLYYQFETAYETIASVDNAYHLYVGGLPTVAESDYYSARSNFFGVGPQFQTSHTSFGHERHLSPFYIDQIAIYDYALPQIKVINHYKKLRKYNTMILRDGASDFWPLDELNDDITYNIVPLTGGVSGKYYGNPSTLIRNQPGPMNFYNEPSVHLTLDAYMYFTSAPFTFSGNFTLELWFKTDTKSEGIILDASSTSIDYTGMLIRINRRNNIALSGAIQVNFTPQKYLTSLTADNNGELYDFTNGEWHHLLVSRNQNITKLWLNGVEHSSLYEPSPQSFSFTNMVLMKAKPDVGAMEGNIAKFAFYQKALSEYLIPLRYNFTTIYRLKGVVTLQGIPTAAEIRVFDHYTGQLLAIGHSDGNDGLYEILLPTNRKVDLMVFDKTDLSVRYRAYGGVYPNELQDLAIY